MMDPMQPSVRTGSLRDGGAVGAPGALQERDSDIFSFLAGSQPCTPAAPVGAAGGTPSPTSVSMAGRAIAQPPVQSCGAAPGMTSEINLLDAAELAQQPQTRNAKSGASGSAPSMAELNMVLKTMNLVPEFPKLEPGDPATRARRLQQWLLQVSQSLEPVGPHVTAWWKWARTSAETAHRVFLTTALDQREPVLPQDWGTTPNSR